MQRLVPDLVVVGGVDDEAAAGDAELVDEREVKGVGVDAAPGGRRTKWLLIKRQAPKI